jgi:hypothetical protein
VFPRWETGVPGFGADLARSSANGRFFWYAASIFASSSGKTKPHPAQPSSSSGVHERAPVFE